MEQQDALVTIYEMVNDLHVAALTLTPADGYTDIEFHDLDVLLQQQMIEGALRGAARAEDFATSSSSITDAEFDEVSFAVLKVERELVADPEPEPVAAEPEPSPEAEPDPFAAEPEPDIAPAPVHSAPPFDPSRPAWWREANANLNALGYRKPWTAQLDLDLATKALSDQMSVAEVALDMGMDSRAVKDRCQALKSCMPSRSMHISELVEILRARAAETSLKAAE